MCKLFIIGNGFDLASGLKTSYKDFREYMCSTYKPTDEFSDKMPKSESPEIITSYDEGEMGRFLYHLINNSCKEENWSDFEKALGNLNFNYPLESWGISRVKDYVNNNGYDPTNSLNNWGDIRDLEGFQTNFNNIIGFLNECFSGWIKNIDLNDGYPIEKFTNFVDLKTSKFLNFNYTMTLENLYNIPKENICHIHVFNENFIFGHGIMEDQTIKYYNNYKDINTALTFQQITESLQKNANRWLEQNKNFFARLNNITDIYSYGFSFSNVDLPYIRRICEVVNTNNAVWYQYRYNGNDYTKVLKDCGFNGKIQSW